MRSPLPRVVCGAGLLVAAGLALPHCLATAAAKLDPFAGDARVGKRVIVSVEGLPVADLLALLARKTGLSLAAAPEVADDKLIVFGQARPLRELLADMAALLNDRWERHKATDGSIRYLLTRDVAARQYEARLAHMVIERMMARLAEQVRALNETPEQLAQRPEQDPIRAFLSEEGVGRMGTFFYAALSPEQREALFARRRLDIPFAALGPEHQEPLRKAWAGRIAAEQEFARQLQAQEPGRRIITKQPEELEKGTLRFRVQHTGGFVSVGLGLGAHPIRVEAAVDDAGQPSYATSGWPIALLDSRLGWLLPARGDPYTGKEPAADAPLPEARVTQAAAPVKIWPDRLRQFAEKSGLSLMADFYRGPPVARPPDASNAETAPDAAAALDALCEPAGYLWWMRGKTLLLRKRDWYEQRSYEIPDRWMRGVSEHLKQNNDVPKLGDLLSLRDLTETQIAGLNSLSRGSYPYDDDELAGLRELLAIAAASGADRNVPLPAPGSAGVRPVELSEATMSPGQRALFPAFLQAQDRLITPPDLTEFHVRFSRSEEKAQAGDRGYRYVPVRIEWSLGRNAAPSVYAVSLPASLPDDRRDRTRIELSR